MKNISIILFTIMLIIVSCKKEQNVNLLYGKWEFECFDKKTLGCKEYPPDDLLRKMSIEFFENGGFGILTECNEGFGSTFDADNKGNFKIEGGAITKVMCPYSEWEERYISALSSSNEYNLYNNKLKIYFVNDDKKNIMIFEKIN